MIIVVQLGSADELVTMGVLVDRVLDVRSIDSTQIEPAPDFGREADAGCGSARRFS